MPEEVIERLFVPDPAVKTGERWLCQPHGAVPGQLSPGGHGTVLLLLPHSRLLQVTTVAQVGLPQAGCAVAGGVGCVAIRVDLHVQGRQQAVELLVDAQGGGEAHHPGPDDGHTHGSEITDEGGVVGCGAGEQSPVLTVASLALPLGIL